jgi:hypothetical protein
MKSSRTVQFGIGLCLFVILVTFGSSLFIDKRSVTADHSSPIFEKNMLNEWNRMMRTHLTFPLDQHYGSHAIVLLAAVFVCRTGAILELGMGSTSTPLLARISHEQQRILLSADSDRRWSNYYSSFSLNNSLHRFRHIDVTTELGVEWAMTDLNSSSNWSLVLIDHRPGARRQFDLVLYAHRSDLVIVHDTDRSSTYQYDHALSYYPFKYRFTRLITYTDALSMRNAKLIEQIRFLLESTPNWPFVNRTSNASV